MATLENARMPSLRDKQLASVLKAEAPKVEVKEKKVEKKGKKKK